MENEHILAPLGMHDQYGPLWRAFFARFFDHIKVPRQALENLRQAARDHTLVYLAPSAGWLHYLFLNHLCNQHGLPPAAFVNGMNTTWLQPVGRLLVRMHQLGQAAFEEKPAGEQQALALRRALSEGQAALLFLNTPLVLTRPEAPDDVGMLLKVLCEVEQELERPLMVVPHLIIWNIYPEREEVKLTDVLFGFHQAPGLLRSLWLLMRHYRHAWLKLAEPIELRSWLAEREKCSDAPGMLREKLLEVLGREVYDVTGPRIRPPEQLKRAVASDRRVVEFIERQTAGRLAEREAWLKRAYDLADEIAAEPRIRWPIFFDRTLQIFWKRMYEGLVPDEDGFERIRRALRESSVVICPSHKSHVDYLIFSQECLYHALPLPHIAAGINLSFWPLGPIFRHSGAFFLRRSFKGDPLYPVVFRTYLRHIMAEGFPIEFFIEGTRSRTGKLLNPRYGILSWLVEAFLDGTGNDVQFFPVSIDYEKIVEANAYRRELSGGEKQKEDMAAVLKSSQALRSKYGKIYLQIGEPISLKKMIEENGWRREEVDEGRKRQLVQELAYGILYRINEVHTVTPSALLAFVLLNMRRRGIGESELLERIAWTLAWIRKSGHRRFSATLEDLPRAVAEAASRFARDGLISIRHTGQESIYAVAERRRLELDYYRNNIVHHFVPASIFVVALESFDVKAVPLPALSERIGELSRLFKFEFLFRSDREFQQEVRRSLDLLLSEKAVDEEGEFVVKTESGALVRSTLRAALEHFLEAYWLMARGLQELLAGPLAEKELLLRAMKRAEDFYFRGELLWPEALNKEILKNALQAFADRGVVRLDQEAEGKSARWALLPPYDQPPALEELASKIRAYLAAKPA